LNIAIIPARAGSKSIINKNLIKINNRENITERAIRICKDSGVFDKIIISTDIQCLLDQENTSKITYLKRKKNLASDTALMKDVVTDVINETAIDKDSWVWLIQPTSPFRSIKNFQEINQLLYENNIKSLISVRNTYGDHQRIYHIGSKGNLRPLKRTNFKNKQDLPSAYLRNGVFYVFKCGEFLKYESFYIWPCKAYVMDDWSSINIDKPIDYEFAKVVEFDRKNKNN